MVADPTAPVPDALAGHAAADPGRPAIIDDHGAIGFGELNALVNRLAHGLLGFGFRPGDRAVWCGPNSREVITFLHAARKIQLMAVPLAYRFTADEMRYVIADSKAVLVVVDAEQADRVAEIRASLPVVRHVLVFGGEPRLGTAGALAWDDVLAGGTETEPGAPARPGGSMIYTSGTTGKPKGALRGPPDPEMTAALVRTLRLRPGNEVHLTTGPLYHSGPLAWASLNHTLGATVVLMRRFDVRRWLELVREHRVTNTFTAPTPLKRIVSLPAEALRHADLSSMRSLVVNAAPMPYALKQEVIARFGGGFLFEVYGSTELGVDTVLAPEDQLRKPGSCGLPVPGVEVAVLDANGKPAASGVAGELFVRSSSTYRGYHGHGPAGDRDGWKSVGDVGYLDEEGYLYICDRLGDMIITGGMNVYPVEIEAVLYAHPDVDDAAVFGVPSAEWGESVHAVVVPRPGRALDPDDLDMHVRLHLAGYKCPRTWSERALLPRTESGKLLKRQLRAEHMTAAER
ncbi:AMP-binding protein [Pseudonocardia asaccharolytica]|uniref:Acyl-CoA synthetase n=1 Tax=Pseudonocardia asaccharolytica DSM 44247 = NBRC 16224 TaxID=1123024 RepID=A0A511D0N4_9PSEU|nr:AMP-binding protein [Pseudonocardia asaccharolytica]GEL18341.1 acyl-CoA synthetase [Pseudonocardia asaccharolytica DSM 44247 = NBRC 16224]